jgi:hypothetical protein
MFKDDTREMPEGLVRTLNELSALDDDLRALLAYRLISGCSLEHRNKFVSEMLRDIIAEYPERG